MEISHNQKSNVKKSYSFFEEYMRKRIKKLGIDLSSDDYPNNPNLKNCLKALSLKIQCQ